MADPAAPVSVTVVTIGLNAARDLPLTLESAIAQDYPALQIVVRDGASWDDSGGVLRRYLDHVDVVVSREDAGVYHAMNDALDHATGDYVIFINAGDRLHRSDAISRVVAGVEGSPDIFYGNHIYVDRGIESLKRSAPFDRIATALDEGQVDDEWHGLIPGHQATFTRLDLLRRLRFDTRLVIGADHDLLFRAWRGGAQMQYLDEIVAHYQGGGMSATMADRCRIENASIYRRFSSDPEAVDRFLYPGGSPFVSPDDRAKELPVGAMLTFHDTPEDLARLLGSGWSGPEPDHVWSTGPISEIWLRTAPGVRVARLMISGNPHVGRTQRLSVTVNDMPVPGTTVPAAGITVLEVDCSTAPWRPGAANRLLLMPDATASCDADSRDMGLALYRVEIA